MLPLPSDNQYLLHSWEKGSIHLELCSQLVVMKCKRLINHQEVNPSIKAEPLAVWCSGAIRCVSLSCQEERISAVTSEM